MEKKLAYNKKILKGVMENGGPVGRDLDNEKYLADDEENKKSMENHGLIPHRGRYNEPHAYNKDIYHIREKAAEHMRKLKADERRGAGDK